MAPKLLPRILTMLCVTVLPSALASQQGGTAPPAAQAAPSGGAHDFDWDIGIWKTHQRRLLHPMTGSTTWVEYAGTDSVRRVWDGANTGVIEADGAGGHLEIFTLRLYNPDTHEWSIYFTNSATGALSLPVVGGFKSGRGEFTDQEQYNGHTILVRFSISDITPTSVRFVQAFSADGGRTWEDNFVVSETLVRGDAGASRSGK